MFIKFFFFNDTATTEIYTLSLHDALPILSKWPRLQAGCVLWESNPNLQRGRDMKLQSLMLRDRKSTRLNSSHSQISYAVFCLKKNNKGTEISNRILNFSFVT